MLPNLAQLEDQELLPAGCTYLHAVNITIGRMQDMHCKQWWLQLWPGAAWGYDSAVAGACM